MKRSTCITSVFTLLALTIAGCQTTPKTEVQKENLDDQASTTLRRFQREDPSLKNLIDNSYAMAMFPSVGKGGLIVGGGYGKGVVWEHGKRVGYADVTLASVGALVGGQTFAELVLFKNHTAFQRFMDNQLTFEAGASAVILKTGAATTATVSHGTFVFIQPNSGAMADASIGGQKFTYAARDLATSRPSDVDQNGNVHVNVGSKTTNNNP